MAASNLIQATRRIAAATYAHNQLYYRDPGRYHAKSANRHSSHPVQPDNRTVAGEIASILKAARDVRSSAGQLMKLKDRSEETRTRPDENEAVERVNRLVTDYNALHRKLAERKADLKPDAGQSLRLAAEGYGFIGLRQHPDGSLQLDETTFRKRWSVQYASTLDAVAGPSGLAGKLSKAAERYDNVPPASWLNVRERGALPFNPYAPFTGYRFQKGLLFDGFFLMMYSAPAASRGGFSLNGKREARHDSRGAGGLGRPRSAVSAGDQTAGQTEDLRPPMVRSGSRQQLLRAASARAFRGLGGRDPGSFPVHRESLPGPDGAPAG
jgi:hypothetical protein